MIWLYRILFLPALILASPYYGMRMLRRGGYAKDFSHRWGSQKNLPVPALGKKRIWLQAVSVGEIQAIAPIVEKLSKLPNVELVITTTTSTGYRILREKYSDKCLYVGVFPIDFVWFSRRAWRHIKPDLAILMEGELWPEHLRQAKERKVPAMLINARMSDKSFKRYSLFPFVSRKIIGKLSKICASSEFDMERFAALGTPRSKLACTGNIKFDSSDASELSSEEKSRLKAEMGFEENSFVLLGSSTWKGEEEMLVKAMEKLRADGIDCRLLLVPRHAERRAEVSETIKTFPHHLRSISKNAAPETLIYLADTTGELSKLTQIADLAFIGKSLPPNVGGQSPIDCAASEVPMVYGPNMTNFRRACETLERERAAIKVPDAKSAIGEIARLAKNPDLRRTIANSAKAWYNSNQGAAQRTFEAIEAELSE